MPLASNAFLIMASACRRIGKFSPGKVIIFIRSWTAKSPSASTPCIFSGSRINGLNSGFLSQFQPDLLDQLSGAVDIAVIGDAYREFVDGPVAALVLDGAQQAERHGVKRAALMPQLDRADAEALDGALVIAALDVFADPKGVVEQVEHASDDIADKILTTKADRNPDNTQKIKLSK